MQRPCCLQVLYHVPAKRSIPFAGLFVAILSGDLPASGRNRRAADLRAGDVTRAGCHGGARGSAPTPLRSRSQIFRTQEKNTMRGAHIRLSACAGLPAPCYYHKPPEGGFRLSCASRSRGIRAFPQGSPRLLYQYQLIYYCRYCRIFDTAFRYF